jgi:hypothetical protein
MPRARRLAGFLAAATLIVAGCAGSVASPSSSALSSAGGVVPDARLLETGLAANFDKLASYRFSEVIYSSWNGSVAPIVPPGSAGSPGSTASVTPSVPIGTGLLRIDGTVVNNGNVPSVRLTMKGVEYVIIGKSAWVSLDGAVWAVTDVGADVLAQLPATYYGIWFEKHASGFAAKDAGEHNGVASTHFAAGDSMGDLYATRGTATFQAELWVAVDGRYPLGGRYLIPTGNTVSGYSFEIYGANQASNVVAAPTNVVALPS